MFYFFVPFLLLCTLFFCICSLFRKQKVEVEKPVSDKNAPDIKYDVFVSFRGKEIRKGFLSHLSEAFAMKKINAFVDDKLEKGEAIWPSLVAAIERSAVSLIIFSPDYASSPWCLREVVKIIECQEKYGRTVIPVFYNIEPTHVKHQSGCYQKAFGEHATKDETELQLWRCALHKSASFSGIKSTNIQNDAEVVKVIVADVLKKLKRFDKPRDDSKGLVGIDEKIASLESWMRNEPRNTCLIGIWGMGGIGKTTLSEIVFNRLRSQYDGSYFLANERDQSSKHGTTHLKTIIFSKLLGEEVDVDTPNSLPEHIVRRIDSMKVLVVLDDVNDSNHIEKLLGSLDNFGMGSTIIVTTRDEQVLRINKVSKTYKLKEFSSDEALELFNLNAFRENDEEREEYNEISKVVVNYAKGNPLVVKVLAHLLHGRNKEEWESLISKFHKMPPKEVYDVMKVSYDSLDREGQQIFLDLACFFLRLHVPVEVGDLKSLLKDNESDNSVAFELRRLEEKALITISRDNIVCMHDSLQEMAWEIVRQESIDDPGSRSRLWDPNDIYEALVNEKVGDAIRSIQIKLALIKKKKLNPQIFDRRQLKFLEISGNGHDCFHRLILAEGVKFMATELRFLSWTYCQSLPECFNAEKLVILKLNIGGMEKLWDGVKNLVNLKQLDLKWCSELKELPDLSSAKRLEKLDLCGCSSLNSVHSSIFSLPKLERLNLAFCYSLTVLASNSTLLSLHYLNLEDCHNLKKFSVISENMKELNLVRTKVGALPSSFGDQLKLESLYLSESDIERLPSLYNLGQLTCLDLSDCEKLQTISELPPLLNRLEVYRCKSLKTLPKFPLALKTLNVRLCSSLESLVELPESLETLKIACPLLQTLPELPPALKTLCVKYFKKRHTLPKLPASLETLNVHCRSLETLPKLPASLITLNVSHCRSLKTLPNLPPSLEVLDARDCESLKTVVFPSIAEEQNRRIVMLPNSVMLDEHSTAAIGLNAEINMMKFANQHLSEPNHNPVKKNMDPYTRSDRCVYVYPGNSVPEWLEYSTRNDCITVDLSSTPPSLKLGFIFSFILDLCSNNSILQCCTTIFDDEDGGKSDSFSMLIYYGFHCSGSNRVCMVIYDQTCSEFLNTSAKNQTKFKIQVTMEDSLSETGTIKQQVLKGFGVSPISTSTYKTFIQQSELHDSMSQFH